MGTFDTELYLESFVLVDRLASARHATVRDRYFLGRGDDALEARSAPYFADLRDIPLPDDAARIIFYRDLVAVDNTGRLPVVLRSPYPVDSSETYALNCQLMTTARAVLFGEDRRDGRVVRNAQQLERNGTEWCLLTANFAVMAVAEPDSVRMVSEFDLTLCAPESGLGEMLASCKSTTYLLEALSTGFDAPLARVQTFEPAVVRSLASAAHPSAR